MREGNVGEKWHETGNNSDGAKKSTPKKSEGIETILLRPTQKKVREMELVEEEKKKKKQNSNELTKKRIAEQ